MGLDQIRQSQTSQNEINYDAGTPVGSGGSCPITVGINYRDYSKLRWRNFPIFLIEELVKVGQMGEKKHGALSFLTSEKITVQDHLDAAFRHLTKLMDPKQDDTDDESGLLHPYHAAWRIIVAGWLIKNKPNLDDRFKG